MDRHHAKVSRDTVLLQNTVFKPLDREIEGPSWEYHGSPGVRSADNVLAIHCKSWPYEAVPWLQRRGVNAWPSSEMKRFAERCGFFVVPVGSKVSQNEALEWRISTSLAERCLMFSLNITQIRCYILMKMIMKTYLNSNGNSHISSYMCKTVLLYCIEKAQPNAWKEDNLISCLSYCLQQLLSCILSKNCPHFIIPGNNLMAGKYLGKIKDDLQNSVCQIIQSKGLAFFGIQIDDLGTRLKIKVNMLQHYVPALHTTHEILLDISVHNVLTPAAQICSIYTNVILHESINDRSEITQQRLLQYLHKYTTAYRDGNMLEQTASKLLAPLICSSLGSMIASFNLQRNNPVSSEAKDWLHEGLYSDVSSGRLKLASVLFCMRDMARTELFLRDIERRLNSQSDELVCGCHIFGRLVYKTQFAEEVSIKDIVHGIRENTSFCVKFLPAELYCIPQELQYEMFRSTEDDLLHRSIEDCWMDLAVVDSITYLYFLQYKTYGLLERYAEQQLALNSLIHVIQNEYNLGHRETAFNLLGQCMEQENRVQDALFCYSRSLNIRERNNAARFHICRLLATLVNPQI